MPLRTLETWISPTRIDLLELDIDLRLADLWREAADVTEWNLEVVSAFMRAAYGKGYCDAFTEDSPGSLCHDHGYEIPGAAHHARGVTHGLDVAAANLTLPTVGRGGYPLTVARKRSPARLVIALSIAAVLAVFLLYTSIAGGGTPSLRPSQLDGHTGAVSLVGKVVGKPTGDSHAGGLRFSLRDVKDPSSEDGRGRLYGQRPRSVRDQP